MNHALKRTPEQRLVSLVVLVAVSVFVLLFLLFLVRLLLPTVDAITSSL